MAVGVSRVSIARRSSTIPLRGMSTPVASFGPPARACPAFDRRWPSVETIRAVTPSDSNSTPARCCRVSSSETEKIVLLIMSRSTAVSTREVCASAMAGSLG